MVLLLFLRLEKRHHPLATTASAATVGGAASTSGVGSRIKGCNFNIYMYQTTFILTLVLYVVKVFKKSLILNNESQPVST